jgi:hypothetical protein
MTELATYYRYDIPAVWVPLAWTEDNKLSVRSCRPTTSSSLRFSSRSTSNIWLCPVKICLSSRWLSDSNHSSNSLSLSFLLTSGCSLWYLQQSDKDYTAKTEPIQYTYVLPSQGMSRGTSVNSNHCSCQHTPPSVAPVCSGSQHIPVTVCAVLPLTREELQEVLGLDQVDADCSSGNVTHHGHLHRTRKNT